MKTDPNSLTIDVSSLMRLSVSDRNAMIRNDNFRDAILSALSPYQVAMMFPRYYQESGGISAGGGGGGGGGLASALSGISGLVGGGGGGAASAATPYTATPVSPGTTAPTQGPQPSSTFKPSFIERWKQKSGLNKQQEIPQEATAPTGPTTPSMPPRTTPGGHPVIAQARAKAIAEVEGNPKLKSTILGLSLKENNGDPRGPMEALFNRAAMTGRSVQSLVYGGFYGPINRGQVTPLDPNRNKALYDKANSAYEDVRGGSNSIQLRTDQGMINEHKWADEHPEKGGKQKFNGEWYSYMGDQGYNWAKKMEGQIKEYDNAKPETQAAGQTGKTQTEQAAAPKEQAKSTNKVAIVGPGIADNGAMKDPNGILDRNSATKLYQMQGYNNVQILPSAGGTAQQTKDWINYIRANPNTEITVDAFSGAASSLKRAWPQLTPEERASINVIGSGIRYKGGALMSENDFPGAKSFKEYFDKNGHYNHFQDRINEYSAQPAQIQQPSPESQTAAPMQPPPGLDNYPNLKNYIEKNLDQDQLNELYANANTLAKQGVSDPWAGLNQEFEVDRQSTVATVKENPSTVLQEKTQELQQQGAAQPSLQMLAASPGRNPNLKDVDPRLLEIVSAGATHLPPGYKVTVNEGYNPGGHVSASQHHRKGSGALDVQIWDPQGNPIKNKGADPTGMYRMLGQHSYGEMLARYPDLKGKFAHGASFGTVSGGTTPDLMHFDLGGERGSLNPTLSQLGSVPNTVYGPQPVQTTTPVQTAPTAPEAYPSAPPATATEVKTPEPAVNPQSATPVNTPVNTTSQSYQFLQSTKSFRPNELEYIKKYSSQEDVDRFASGIQNSDKYQRGAWWYGGADKIPGDKIRDGWMQSQDKKLMELQDFSKLNKDQQLQRLEVPPSSPVSDPTSVITPNETPTSPTTSPTGVQTDSTSSTSQTNTPPPGIHGQTTYYGADGVLNDRVRGLSQQSTTKETPQTQTNQNSSADTNAISDNNSGTSGSLSDTVGSFFGFAQGGEKPVSAKTDSLLVTNTKDGAAVGMVTPEEYKTGSVKLEDNKLKVQKPEVAAQQRSADDLNAKNIPDAPKPEYSNQARMENNLTSQTQISKTEQLRNQDIRDVAWHHPNNQGVSNERYHLKEVWGSNWNMC